MTTQTLEKLLDPSVDLTSVLSAYLAVLREAAQAHRPPDDFKFADRLGGQS